MGDTSTESSSGILAIWNDCKIGEEFLYEKWYQGEHLHDRVSIPGFKLGRRHKSVDRTPKYFTYYETTSAEVLFSEAYLHQRSDVRCFYQRIPHGLQVHPPRG